MPLRLPDRALIVKLFYPNDNSAIGTLRKFRTLKGMRKGPLTVKNLRLMVTKFEETESLNVRSGRVLPVSAFLARLEVDSEWPWNILWTDEAPFHLNGSVNTHNCQIWETDNPHSTLQVPLHSPKVTVWCGFSTSFILGPYFFEELGAGGPVTCSITGQRFASLLRNKIIPDLQAHQCFNA
ncbi:uncharacterized protein TNCV_2859311 [Trichonephila clavipes]|nr:uncharacterized protein TNCV_2859311 [Trichonephila clavipes]